MKSLQYLSRSNTRLERDGSPRSFRNPIEACLSSACVNRRRSFGVIENNRYRWMLEFSRCGIRVFSERGFGAIIDGVRSWKVSHG